MVNHHYVTRVGYSINSMEHIDLRRRRKRFIDEIERGRRVIVLVQRNLHGDSADEGDDEVESPVMSEFAFRRQSQVDMLRAEEEEIIRNVQVVPYLPEFLGQPQYQYQWQVQSV